MEHTALADILDISIFVEFGVGLAGFAGVVVAFGLRSGKLDEFDRFRVEMLLSFALLPAFISTLPLVFAGFNIFEVAAWRATAAILIFCLAGLLFQMSTSARQMSPDIRSRMNLGIWIVAFGGTVLAFVWNGLNLWGWPIPFSIGPLLVTMVYLLFLASLMFLRLLIVRIGDLGISER